jgi:bifunctional DNA-binding transcriptional regulator/antitoxin component of YhaV-PrlF toxin-antitoxin module
LREKYGIKENDYVFIELRDNELVITRALTIDETLEWIRLRRKRLKAKQASLEELSDVDLEEEFGENTC